MVYPNVVDFLPGGLSVSYGVATPRWELLKSFNNSSTSTLKCMDTVYYRNSGVQTD